MLSAEIGVRNLFRSYRFPFATISVAARTASAPIMVRPDALTAVLPGPSATKRLYVPASAQEMCDLAFTAFDLAEKYRIVVYMLTDGVIGQTMETVTLPEPLPRREGEPETKEMTC